ncbi:hypothetical protein [Geomonas agri]|uniref:hypothetical protein n=1 Tax=Geomonas agri TaxID=2873702 RepID=UPI001CD58593|nr:hypothetical protein [Geomonas agri]
MPHLRRLELEAKLLELRVALLESGRLTVGHDEASPFACLALLMHGLIMDAKSLPIYEETLRHCDKLLSLVQNELDG